MRKQITDRNFLTSKKRLNLYMEYKIIFYINESKMNRDIIKYEIRIFLNDHMIKHQSKNR